MKFINYFLSVILILIVLSCDMYEMETDQSDSEDKYTTLLWLGAVNDVHISSTAPDNNHNNGFSLVCSHGEPNQEKRIYIKFYMPELPEGAEVTEAFINIYEDYKTGLPGSDIIQIGEAAAAWDVNSISWNNQPNAVGELENVAANIGLFTTNNTWRSSTDITKIVTKHIEHPATNNGWILNHIASGSFTRSFKSLNAPDGRTHTDLKLGPRLLLKIRSSDPLEMENIISSLNSNNELNEIYGTMDNVALLKMVEGDNWPGSWYVTQN